MSNCAFVRFLPSGQVQVLRLFKANSGQAVPFVDIGRGMKSGYVPNSSPLFDQLRTLDPEGWQRAYGNQAPELGLEPPKIMGPKINPRYLLPEEKD